MNKILIIGTEPPCPRCGLLLNVVTKKIKEFNISAEINHLSYTDERAKDFANSIGLEPGTAKDVAERINKQIDPVELINIFQNNKSEENYKYKEFKEYNDCNWSYELDEFLRPYEMKAKEARILMTPVLIINGELKHQGSVPEMKKIEEWLLEIKNE